MVAAYASDGPYFIGQTVTFRWLTGIQSTKLMAPAAAGATTITVGDTTGYASTDSIVIRPSHPSEGEERRTISGTPGEHSIVLTTALAFAHSVGEVVGELATPTAVLTITQPDGVAVTPAPTVTSSAGVHTATHTLTQAGQHKIQWRGTGSGGGELEYTIDVLSNLIT